MKTPRSQEMNQEINHKRQEILRHLQDESMEKTEDNQDEIKTNILMYKSVLKDQTDFQLSAQIQDK